MCIIHEGIHIIYTVSSVITLLQVLSPAYGNRVKNRAMALVETYDRVINEEKARVRF